MEISTSTSSSEIAGPCSEVPKVRLASFSSLPKKLPQIPTTQSRNILYPSPPASPRATVISVQPTTVTSLSLQPRIKHHPKVVPPPPQTHTPPGVYKKKHHTYVIVSETTNESQKLCYAIQDEHHMHVSTAPLISVFTNEVIIVVCTQKGVSTTSGGGCRVVNPLIRSQNGKVVCVCILPELNRRDIVDTKRKMMLMMNEDHIVFASYDRRHPNELYTPEKFWEDVHSVIGD
jgi:hypothetical protein